MTAGPRTTAQDLSALVVRPLLLDVWSAVRRAVCTFARVMMCLECSMRVVCTKLSCTEGVQSSVLVQCLRNQPISEFICE